MGSKAKELAKLLSGSGQGGTIAPALVSDQQNTSTGLFSLPAGTSAERPGTSYNGSLRYNTEFNRLEQFTPDGWAAIDTPPTIETLAYVGDDLAADTAGGTVITLTGQNFQDSFTVTVGGTLSATVTYVSSTQVTFVAPAKSSGDYDVVLQNANGLTATLQSGISYSGTPNFSTAAALGEYSSATTIPTITIVASDSDGGAISYTVTSGALPTGLTLNADGTVTGTTPSVTGTETSYFTVEAVDDENQSNTRTFNIVVLRSIYAYSLPESLRSRRDTSSMLQYVNSTTGNQRRWTLSFWVKKSDVGALQYIYQIGDDNWCRFDNDKLTMNNRNGATNYFLQFAYRFRDPSAWYHIVLAYNSYNAETDRVKFYVNGTRYTDLADYTTYPPDSHDVVMNANWTSQSDHQRIHRFFYHTGNNTLDGYIADAHLVDGTELGPSSFAEDYRDVWVPKAYTGSHGTNGWHILGDQSDQVLYNVTGRPNGLGSAGSLVYSDPDFSKFGKDAIRFNGAYLYWNTNSNYAIPGNGTFTIEFWLNAHRWNGDNEGLMWWGDDLNPHGSVLWLSNSRNGATDGLDIYFNHAGTGSGSDTGFIPSLDTWYHLAVTYNNRTVKFWVDGVLTDTFTISSSEHLAQSDYFGIGGGGNRSCNASFADFRFSNVERYTANFTPPTEEFVRDSSTILLLQNLDGTAVTSHSTGYQIFHDVNKPIVSQATGAKKLYPVNFTSSDITEDSPTE